eukprot:308952-Pelagomonas_calceolata.AAC.2
MHPASMFRADKPFLPLLKGRRPTESQGFHELSQRNSCSASWVRSCSFEPVMVRLFCGLPLMHAA